MVQFMHAVSAPVMVPSRRPRLEVHAARRLDTMSRIVETCAREGLSPRSLEGRQSCGGYWVAIEFDCGNAPVERVARQLRTQALVSALVFVPGEESEAADRAPVPEPRALALA